MSVGLNTNNGITNVASNEEIAKVQQQNFEGHTFSLGKTVIDPSFIRDMINDAMPHTALRDRSVCVANKIHG